MDSSELRFAKDSIWPVILCIAPEVVIEANITSSMRVGVNPMQIRPKFKKDFPPPFGWDLHGIGRSLTSDVNPGALTATFLEFLGSNRSRIIQFERWCNSFDPYAARKKNVPT